MAKFLKPRCIKEFENSKKNLNNIVQPKKSRNKNATKLDAIKVPL